MDRHDILIRLLKEGHITDEEFKFLYHQGPTGIIRGEGMTFTPIGKDLTEFRSKTTSP